MLSIRGIFQDGVAKPAQDVEGREGQEVLITFLEDRATATLSEDEAAWEVMAQLVENCAVETGIRDLAHQHDHYLYKKPKRP